MENEGHVSARQTTRKWRHRLRPETEIKNRHREVVGVSSRHPLVKSMTHIDDDRAHSDQGILQSHRQEQIVFDHAAP